MKKINEILKEGKKISKNLAKSINGLGKIQELEKAASNLSPEEFQEKFKEAFGIESDPEKLENLIDYYSSELGHILKHTKSFSDNDKERLFYLIGECKTEKNMKNFLNNVSKVQKYEELAEYYRDKALNF